MKKATKIRGYKIKKELGVGGMARVYLAWDTMLERPVALKVLSSAFAENQQISRRFIKEAKTAAMLNHPNIVSIFDIGREEEMYYIAMEYLKENLKDRIKRMHGIKPREALAIIKDVAKALFYAHKKGYIHRDIKPDNIMFREDGTVVLVDFGIVKAIGSETKLTKTGLSIGTPLYMSPEQCNAASLDGRTDIYSLGVVLYEMLTGTPPFTGEDTLHIAMQHFYAPIPLLPKRLSEYQVIINRMMVKNRRKRLHSEKELNKIIKRLIDFKNTNQNGETKITERTQERIADSKTQTAVQSKSEGINLELLKVFISYAKEDIHKVRPIYEALKNAGYNPWLDEIEISAGQIWEYEIEKAITESSVFLACFSEKSVNKIGYVQKELKMGLKILDMYPEGRIFVIPIRLENCNVPFNLQHIQWCDVFEDNGIENLLKTLDRCVAERGLVWFSAKVLKGPDEGKEFKIPSHHITIGRDEKNDIFLTDPKVSTLHAKIERRRTKVVFSHLSEKNHSIIQCDQGAIKLERTNKREYFLINGDIITIGETQIKVSIKDINTNIDIVTTVGVETYKIVDSSI